MEKIRKNTPKITTAATIAIKARIIITITGPIAWPRLSLKLLANDCAIIRKVQ